MVMGVTFEEQSKNLACVLDRWRQAGLRLKPSKCHFVHRSVEYLGYAVTEQWIVADPRRWRPCATFLCLSTSRAYVPSWVWPRSIGDLSLTSLWWPTLCLLSLGKMPHLSGMRHVKMPLTSSNSTWQTHPCWPSLILRESSCLRQMPLARAWAQF